MVVPKPLIPSSSSRGRLISARAPLFTLSLHLGAPLWLFGEVMLHRLSHKGQSASPLCWAVCLGISLYCEGSPGRPGGPCVGRYSGWRPSEGSSQQPDVWESLWDDAGCHHQVFAAAYRSLDKDPLAEPSFPDKQWEIRRDCCDFKWLRFWGGLFP